MLWKTKNGPSSVQNSVPVALDTQAQQSDTTTESDTEKITRDQEIDNSGGRPNQIPDLTRYSHGF